MQQTLTLSPLTNIAILVMAAAQLLLIGAIVFLVLRMKTIVRDAVDKALQASMSKIQPVVDNVARVTGQVGTLVETVAPKVQNIASDSESAVHSVSEKVKTTSSIVTEGVAKPLVNFAALLAGLERGLTVWKTAKAHHDVTSGARQQDRAPSEKTART